MNRRRLNRCWEKNLRQIRQKNRRKYLARCEWLERRPPWWKFWAVRKWKGEEPK